MPFDPFTQSASISENCNETQVESLADVLSWIDDGGSDLETDTRLDYSRAVKLVGKRLRKPLSSIPASTVAFRAEFPDAEYSLLWGKSFNAFKRWKGKVCAAINGATGAIAAKAERRARDDDWRTLIDVLSDIAARTPPEDALFHEKEIIGVTALADAARRADVPGPRHIPGCVHDILAEAADSGQRKAIIDALHLCDRIRTLRDNRLGQLLPDDPIAYSPVEVAQIEIPDHLLAELDIWIDLATRGEWSLTKKAYGKGIARKPYQDATRKVIRTAHQGGGINLAEIQTIASAFSDSVLTQVVRIWRKEHEAGERGTVAPRTAKNYLDAVKCFLERNGECTDLVRNILATDDWIQSGEAGRGMPERAKRLCRRVVTDMPTRLAFLSLHISYRDAAEDCLKMAEADPKTRSHALLMARLLGTCAAFAALETDAVPARVGNALACPYRGRGAWLELGHGRKQHGHLHVPASETKNGKAINAPIRADSRLRGLETLRWYEEKIRPLFPYHAESDYFFPAVQTAGEPLSYATLLKWWKKTIGNFGFPGMNPHMFRHGQASILVANNPGDWQTVSARLGDTEFT
ncbi:tyrosine-type recombinase/integrase, partial [Roseovarius gahaiensis]